MGRDHRRRFALVDRADVLASAAHDDLPSVLDKRPVRVVRIGEILTKAGELVGSTSAFLFAALSATTRATALFIFHFCVLLYTMFFFLTGGLSLLGGVLAYLPLTEADKQRMVGKFVSVTRATLKGTILIGAAQGLLGGVAFWAVG